MPYKAIARLIPTIQATQLAGKNLEIAKKKKVTTKDMLGLGVTNVAGLGIIQAESQLIGTL